MTTGRALDRGWRPLKRRPACLREGHANLRRAGEHSKRASDWANVDAFAHGIGFAPRRTYEHPFRAGSARHPIALTLHTRPKAGYLVLMAVVVHWNGKDVPNELRTLPEGRYVIESVDAAPALSPDEEAGLEQAIDSLRQGQGVPAEAVFRRIEERLPR